MNPSKPLVFWIVTLALVVMIVVLLRQVLLPFVAGFALAYLLDPLANRLERLGLNRAMATLLILGLFILGVTTLLIVAIPIVGAEIAALIENLPAYIKRVQALVVDRTHPWLSKIIGVGLAEAQQSSSELTSMGASWLPDLLRSLWSDGRALLSVFSLLVVTPIVTAYLVYDWNRIMTAFDDAVPLAQRNTVRVLAREIDDKITGYLRGQGIICLILATYYVVALQAFGLNHALLIGLVTDYWIRSLSWLAHGALAVGERSHCAIWANLDARSGCRRHLFHRPITGRLCPGTLSRWEQSAFEPRLAHLCSVCLRVFVRSRRAVDRRPSRGIDRRTSALRAQAAREVFGQRTPRACRARRSAAHHDVAPRREIEK